MKINRQQRLEKIKELRDKGMTYAAIAMELGIGLVALSKFRKGEEERSGKPKKQSMYSERRELDSNENVVAVGADGYMVSVSDGKHWVSVRSKKLRKAIAEAFSLQSWIQA